MNLRIEFSPTPTEEERQAILMPLRFLTSMKVEILTSATQTGVACAYGNTLYTLD